MKWRPVGVQVFDSPCHGREDLHTHFTKTDQDNVNAKSFTLLASRTHTTDPVALPLTFATRVAKLKAYSSDLLTTYPLTAVHQLDHAACMYTCTIRGLPQIL